MTQEELINVFKYIVKKCDMLINGDDYKADDYTQDNVEDIAELCNHILDGDYGKLAEESTMTQEEKAQEIGKQWYFDTMNPNEAAYKASIQMAKWKEHQMIEKACEWLIQQEEMIGISFENDFIERFKKAMEE